MTVKRVEGVCESSILLLLGRAWKTGAVKLYRYLCSNERVGAPVPSIPRFKDDVPLVIDCSRTLRPRKLNGIVSVSSLRALRKISVGGSFVRNSPYDSHLA